MLTCKEISRLVSESLDRKLPFRLRMEVRLHLMMCNLCRAYRNRTLLLRKILRRYDALLEEETSVDSCLSERASARIKKALEDAAGG